MTWAASARRLVAWALGDTGHAVMQTFKSAAYTTVP